jgi:hypothetical protein
MTILKWRFCAKCRKSYDAIYAGWFGCRACQHTEPV